MRLDCISKMDNAVVNNEGRDDGTYFMDDQGRYYFMPKQPRLITPINTRTVSPREETTYHTDEVQTLTVPPESEGDETSYLIVIQQPERLNETNASITIEENYDKNYNDSSEMQYDNQVTIDEDSKHFVDLLGDNNNINMTKENIDIGLNQTQDQEQQVNTKIKADEVLSVVSKITDVKNREDDVGIKDNVEQEKKVYADFKAGQFFCRHCVYTTSLRYMIKRHMITHTDELNFKCMDCGRGFKTMRSLKTHSTVHIDERPHRCKDCKKTFKRTQDLIRHTRYKHDQKNKFICSHCERSFVESYKLKLHIKDKHGSRDRATFKCEYCSYSSNIEYSVKRHMLIHNSIKQHSCQYCDKSFSRPCLLQHHINRLHHNIKTVLNLSCNNCSFICKRKQELIIHIRKMHTSSKQIECRICRESMPDKYTYKVHRKIHKDQKYFKCNVCSYETTMQQQIISHYKVHAVRVSYHCNDCEKTFTVKWRLAHHWHKTHDPANFVIPKKNVYYCNECNKGFTIRSSLVRHISTHKNERNLVCQVCNRTFTKMTSLKMHMKTHTSNLNKIEMLDCGQDTFTVSKMEENISESNENFVVIMLQQELDEMTKSCMSVDPLSQLQIKEEKEEINEM